MRHSVLAADVLWLRRAVIEEKGRRAAVEYPTDERRPTILSE
jgi:hypothetical protein